MSLVEEIEKLQELHDNGVLTDEEFTRAKALVLSSAARESDGQGSASSGSVPVLKQIQHQNEIARLDREWELEREKYMITGRYGSRHIPSEGSSILGALLIGGFGVAWMIFTASIEAPAIFPLFGVVFITLGVGGCLGGLGKASQYRDAYEGYQRRRAELLAQDHPRQR